MKNNKKYEKTEAGGAFFIFHQITDELSTKHKTRLRTTRKYSEVTQMFEVLHNM